MQDPYQTLGVSRDATDDEIKTAYRNLAKKYHPDNYAESPLADVASEKMKEINEAYDTIINERRNRAKGGAYGGSAGPGIRSRVKIQVMQGMARAIPPVQNIPTSVCSLKTEGLPTQSRFSTACPPLRATPNGTF